MTVSQLAKFNATKWRENGVITEKQIQGSIPRSKPKVWLLEFNNVLHKRGKAGTENFVITAIFYT